jgi:hypothetical protein
MHFGAAVRELLSATCGEDLRHAKPHRVIDALASARTRRLLGANIAATFGVRVAARDLARLTTVRDVLQCVRLYRWAERVERGRDALLPDVTDDASQACAKASPEDATAVDVPTPTTIAARAVDPEQQRIRITRRRAGATSPPAERGTTAHGPKRS